MSEGKFRSALNGFNRQDVTAYIEGMAQRSKIVKEERDALEKQVRELKEQLDHSTRDAAAEREKLQEEMETERAKLREELERSSREAETGQKKLQEDLQEKLDALRSVSGNLAAVTAEAEELRNKNAALEAELDRCREASAQAEAQAKEYAMVKDRVVKLELGASRRAVEIEQNASLRASEMLRQAEEKTSRVNQKREEQVRSYRGELDRLAQETGFQAELLRSQLGQLTDALLETSRAIAADAERFAAFQDAEEEPAEIPEEIPAEAELPAEEQPAEEPAQLAAADSTGIPVESPEWELPSISDEAPDSIPEDEPAAPQAEGETEAE